MAKTARDQYKATVRRIGPATPRSPLEHALNIMSEDEYQSEWQVRAPEDRIFSQPGCSRHTHAIKVQHTMAFNSAMDTRETDEQTQKYNKTRIHTEHQSINSSKPVSQPAAVSRSFRTSSVSGAASPNLEPVSFENTLMRMGDEKRLRAEVAQALIDQRELFEKRQEYTAAIERNFAILKKVSQRQKEEFRAAMVHSENCTRSYEHLKKEHVTLLETNERMSKDLDRLRKKEVQFDLVLANKLQYINKIDLLETQKAKLETRNGQLQSEIESNAADITQLKRTIFDGEDKIKELEEALRQMDSRGGKLQVRVEELQLDNQEMTKKLTLLDDQYAISQFKLKKAKADIVDKDDEIAAYKEENDAMKTK